VTVSKSPGQPGPYVQSSLSLASGNPRTGPREEISPISRLLVYDLSVGFGGRLLRARVSSGDAAARAAKAEYVRHQERGHRLRAFFARRRFARLAADLDVAGLRERVGSYAVADLPLPPEVELRSSRNRRSSVERRRGAGALFIPPWAERRSGRDRRSLPDRRMYVLAGSYLGSRRDEYGQR
jgi:hypothetical protein